MATIVGISPGTRHAGIAVLTDGELLHWKVQTFKGAWSKAKRQLVATTFRELLDTRDIERVAVKVPDRIPASKGYAQVLGVINVLCEQKGMKARYYTLSELKKHYSQGHKADSKAVISHIVHRYPELLPEYRKEAKRGVKYYHKVFEAVAAALCTAKGHNWAK